MRLSLTRILFAILLVFSGPAFGQDTRISVGEIFDGEPFMTINPSNPQHLVVAWMGFDGLDLVQIKVRISLDGGTTWSTPIDIPHITPGYTCADPNMDWDSDGNVYLCYIDSHPAGTNGKVVIRKSADGGFTWDEPIEVIDAWDDGVEVPVDRPWMAIDRSGGPLDGAIYITTKPAPWIPFPNRNYLTVSLDGLSFGDWRYIDTIGWQIGDFIQAPMAAPAMGSDGLLHIAYPAWEFTENLLPRFVHAVSANGGESFSYAEMQESAGDDLSNDTTSKKGYQLLVDPINPNHLAFLWIFAPYGDNDIYMLESMDGGDTWDAPERINDDAEANDVMQDLVWADFDADGDLAVCWRDRRNAADTGFAVQSEIWCAVRWKDSLAFSPNFRVSSTLLAFDPVLYENGNDFMAVQFAQDTVYAAWGDTRDAVLRIWFNKVAARDMQTGIEQALTLESLTPLTIYPNPATDQIRISGPECSTYQAIDLHGNHAPVILQADGSFSVAHLASGYWFISGSENGQQFIGSFIKINN